MLILLETAYTKISIVDKNTDTIYIVFNGLNGNPNYIDNINIDEKVDTDFYSLTDRATTIFVTDKKMSWGNYLEWDLIQKFINPIIKNKKSIIVGLSMGGTNAILSSQFLNADKLLAMNPQFSIHPLIYPDNDWSEWANLITDWKFPTIETGFYNKTKTYLLLASQEAPDFKFKNIFPKHYNLFEFGKPYGHNIALDLKRQSRLTMLFDAVKTDNIDKINLLSEFYFTQQS